MKSKTSNFFLGVIGLVLAGVLSTPAFAINLADEGFDKGNVFASRIAVDCTHFTQNLSCADTDVQHALNTLDLLTSGGGGGGTWGSITGTLSNQTDLQTALNNRISKTGSTTTTAVIPFVKGISIDTTTPPPVGYYAFFGDSIQGDYINFVNDGTHIVWQMYDDNDIGYQAWYDFGSDTFTQITSNHFVIDGNLKVPTGRNFTVTDLNSSLIKTDASGIFGKATAGSDYEVPLTFSTGLTRTTNTVTVNTSQNIATLSNLTTNGLVYTTGGTGTLNSGPMTGDVTTSGVTATITLSVPHAWTGQQNTADASITSTSNSIAWNVATAQNATHTATENTTLANPTNMVAGGVYTLVWTQHASSPKTLAFGNAYKWPSGASHTVTATNSAVDMIVCKSDGTNMYCTMTNNYS